MPGADVAAQAWARITVPYIAQRPVMRRSPDGGVSFPRSSSKGYRYEVAIKAALPNRPTTVPVFDGGSGRGRLLVLDLDASRVPADGAADRAGYVAAVAEQAVRLVQDCGGRALVDCSPSGGRHVYVLWAESLPFRELRSVARALALRLAPVVDTSPMENSDGQIRGPGAPHKSSGGHLTGFMALACSVEEAEAICARPNPQRVWEALLVELAAELDAAAGQAGRVWEAPHPDAPDAMPGVELDTAGEPYRPRAGGCGVLSADLERTARTGQWDLARYRTSSEARQGVLTSAAGRGWQLQQVRDRLAGDWAAIAHWWRDEARLTAEWDKAIAFTTQQTRSSAPGAQEVGESVRERNTSEITFTPPAPLAPTSTPGSPHPVITATEDTPSIRLYNVKRGNPWGISLRTAPWSLSIYQHIRVWQNAMRIVERTLELEWGERALTYRAILRAIGAAAQMSGRLEVEFGSRQVAYMAAVDHSTVTRALKDLREGPYAMVDLVQQGRGVRGDLYSLVVPDAIAAEAARRTWRPGRIDAIHPAFRPMTRGAAFAYEALGADEINAADLAIAALLPRSTTYDALAELAACGLAERGPCGGWRRGPADLDQLAEHNGGRADADHQLAGHRADRTQWHDYLGIIEQLKTTMSPVAVPSPRRGRPRPLAPAWLVPPPRRPIGEIDIDWPAEAHAALTELASADPVDTGLPPDLQAVIDADHQAERADQLGPGDLAEYTAALNQLRVAQEATDAAAPDPPLPQSGPGLRPAPADATADDRPGAPDSATERRAAALVPHPAGEVIAPHEAEHQTAATRGAALARRLLQARTAAERERILAETAPP